jgi:hypothetical protein
MLRFIVYLTKDAPSHADINAQASTMMERLRLPEGVSYFVPSSPSADYKEIFDSWTQSASTLGADYEKLTLNDLMTEKLGQACMSIVSTLENFKEKDNQLTVEFNQELLNGARQNVKNLKVDFDTWKNETEKQKVEFDKKFQEWKKARKREELLAAIVSSVECTIAICLTVYTFGCSTPVTGPAAAKALNDIKGVLMKAEVGMTASGDAVKSKFEKLKDIGTTLAGVHEKAEKANELYKKYNAKKENPDPKVDDLTATMRTNDSPDLGHRDYYDLQLKWADFELDNEDSFKQLAKINPPLPNLDEYHLAVKRMILRAKTFLAAQKEENDARIRVQQSEKYQQLLDSRKQELRTGDEVKLPRDAAILAKKDLLDVEISTVSRWLTLATHNWTLSRTYEAALPALLGGTHLVPEMKSSSYAQFASKFLTSLNEASAKSFDIIKVPFTFTTKDKVSIFNPNWKNFLVSNNLVEFQIQPGHPKLEGRTMAFITTAT